MSTEAAVKYLKYLKDFQQNDWFMAMASYNAGEERVRKLLKEQKITDYWKMHGPRETMRYVPRIIAAKEIYSQPEKYLGLSKKDLYIPLETETVTVNVKESQRALTSIAEEFGTYFLELKMLNPELRKTFSLTASIKSGSLVRPVPAAASSKTKLRSPRSSDGDAASCFSHPPADDHDVQAGA